MNTDTLKTQLLRLLQQNARMSSDEMADRLQTTPNCINELIAEMENAKTILGYYALINEDNVADGNVRAVIEVEIQPERDGGFDHVASTLCKFPEVKTMYLVSGRSDLRLEVVGDSLQEVASFVASKLAPVNGVKSTVTHFLLKKYKEAGFTFHDDETYSRLKVVP